MNSRLQAWKVLWEYRFKYIDFLIGFWLLKRKPAKPANQLPDGFDGLARLCGSFDMLHCRFEVKEKSIEDTGYVANGWITVDVDCLPLGVMAHTFDFTMHINSTTLQVWCDVPQLIFHKFSADYSIPQLAGSISADLDRLELTGNSEPSSISYVIKAGSYTNRA